MKGRVSKGSSRSGQGDDALIMCDELDLDGVSEFPGLKTGDENAQAREMEPVVEYGPETLGKAQDPVRIYLREMGSFPLLTRAGEVEIAKRIESGQREVLSVVLNCPIAIKEVIILGDALHAGTAKIKEITNEIDEEETSVEEEQIQKKKVLNLINKIQRGEARIRILRGELRLRNKEVPKKEIQKNILKNRTRIFDAFERINLREKQINRIVLKLKHWDIRMEKTIGEKEKYEKGGMKPKDLEEMDRIARNVKRKVGRMEVECGLSSGQIKEAVRAIERGETKAKEA